MPTPSLRLDQGSRTKKRRKRRVKGEVAVVRCLHHGQDFLVQFCRRLRGADRGAFQAEVAIEVCGGSPRRVESTFGWRRKSVQKGLIEQEYHLELQPHFDRRGRRACEVQSPTLASVGSESASKPLPRGRIADNVPGHCRDGAS